MPWDAADAARSAALQHLKAHLGNRREPADADCRLLDVGRSCLWGALRGDCPPLALQAETLARRGQRKSRALERRAAPFIESLKRTCVGDFTSNA
jgi:hypothetical protein